MEKTFEENLEMLEEVVKSLENGDLKLDEALEKFKTGIELTKSCTKKLDDVEKQIKILVNEDNELVEENFELEE
ncbi:MAG: exodeoxyribonuclease VII small subunit [Clostridia bacterium]